LLQEKQVLLIDTQKSRGFARADTLITHTGFHVCIYAYHITQKTDTRELAARAQRDKKTALCGLFCAREHKFVSGSAAASGERRLARTDPLDRVFYQSGCATAGGPFAHKPLDLATMRINKMKSAHDAGSCLVPAAFRSLLVPRSAYIRTPFISRLANISYFGM
jgi:hypothetical protein